MSFFGRHKTWAVKQGPSLLLITAITSMGAIYLGNKFFYAPYARRQKLKHAEEYANFVFETENARKH